MRGPRGFGVRSAARLMQTAPGGCRRRLIPNDAQNRPLEPPKSQNFLRTRFRRCAPALAASVQNRPLRARSRKIFLGLPPALRACARRPRPAATGGWREGPTPQSVRRNMRKRGTATPSHAAVLGSNLLCRLSKFHKQLIHCFQMEGTSGAPRKGASRDIHFATIFENRSKIGPKSADNTAP